MDNKTTPTTQQSPSLLKEILERRHKTFVDLDDIGFFLGIADYVDAILKSSELSSIIEENIRSEELNKREEIDDLAKKCELDLKKSAGKLLELANNKGIKSLILNFEIFNKKKNREEKNYLIWYPVIHDYDSFHKILASFVIEGNKNIIKDFANITEKGVIIEYTFSPTYPLLKEKIEIFNKDLDRTVWGSWLQVLLIYSKIRDYDRLTKRIETGETPLMVLDPQKLFADPDNILSKSPQKKSDKFNKKDYTVYINQLHNDLMDKLAISSQENLEKEAGTRKSNKEILSPRLTFYPTDGIAEYKTAIYPFTGKGRALLIFLNESKNTPFSEDNIKDKCNSLITVERHFFKGDKDIRDTVGYIRERLKVNKGEFFPIHKTDNNWIWLEK